jgi:hypothetical protein
VSSRLEHSINQIQRLSSSLEHSIKYIECRKVWSIPINRHRESRLVWSIPESAKKCNDHTMDNFRVASSFIAVDIDFVCRQLMLHAKTFASGFFTPLAFIDFEYSVNQCCKWRLWRASGFLLYTSDFHFVFK